jgi:RimJ/RimL family protein N-acetyltransferase
MGSISIDKYKIKTGETITVRSTSEKDAKNIYLYVDRAISETDFFIMQPGERKFSVDKERKFIERILDNPGWVGILAELDGEVAGYLYIDNDSRKRVSHVGNLHMSVASKYRRLGIGSILLDKAVDWAKDNPGLEKICLSVFSTNEIAVRLYKKNGFKEEALRKKQYKIAEGSYVDEIIMYLFV